MLPFLGEQQILSGQSYTETFRLSIPDDALPSLKREAYEDPCAEISWRVQASLDMPGAKDIYQTQSLIVLPSVPDSSTPVAEKQTTDECIALLSLSSATVSTGGTVEGKFSIQVRKDFKVHNIRMQLECWQKAGEKETNTVKDSVLLKNPVLRESLTANQMLEWPISLRVPKKALPSAGTPLDNTQVVWRVKGIITRFVRRSLEVQQQVQVYIAPSAS